jgi:hypothetical protein
MRAGGETADFAGTRSGVLLTRWLIRGGKIAEEAQHWVDWEQPVLSFFSLSLWAASTCALLGPHLRPTRPVNLNHFSWHQLARAVERTRTAAAARQHEPPCIFLPASVRLLLYK